MKKIIIMLMLNALVILALKAQNVTNYTYKLDNGISVRMEQCWNHVWVSQAFEAVKASDQTSPLVINPRTLGFLTSGSTFKLFSSGKELKIQGIKPGTYSLRQTFKLSGKPGTITFNIENVEIKPQTKTTLSIILYDYQILIDEKAENQNGQASYSSKIERYKGNAELNPSCGILAFYEKGKHDKPFISAEGPGSKNGSIKPGSYDVLVSLGAPGNLQKIWLENFIIKANVSYSLTTNLNAGVIEYLGGNKEVKAFHLYPAGSADKQKGNPAPDKNLEIMKCESQTTASSCPPGTYDVLLNISNGKKYEWRKNIPVTTGSRSQVK
jgi:hypothetical protein